MDKRQGLGLELVVNFKLSAGSPKNRKTATAYELSERYNHQPNMLTTPLPPGPCFNYDIVELILNASDQWWSCDLVNLSLISSVWLESVRRRLYATPRVTTFRACSDLARTLDRRPSLVEYMRGVEVCPIGRGDDAAGGNGLASVRTILGVVGLKTITIGGELAHCANRFLHSIFDLEAVEELHIDGRALESSPLCGRIASLEWDELISFGLPNLKRLRLTSLELEIMPLAYDGFNTSIEELSLDDVTIPLGSLSNVFNETSSLQKLYFRTQCEPEANIFIRDALSCCHLQELEYEVLTESSSESTILDDETLNLAYLRSLRFSGVNADRDFLDVIGQRCSNLKELIVRGRGVTISSEEWVTFVASGSLPGLSHLGLPWGTKHPPYSKWTPAAVDNLYTVVSRRNIRLLDEHRV